VDELPFLNFVQLHGMPVFKQLQLEEALLRTDERNWCLVNRGAPPAIVLGISSEPELWVDREQLQKAPIPVFRRFSGGGTVVVDEHTLFATFICNEAAFDVPAASRSVHAWSETIYKKTFKGIPFSLQENDYTFEDKKIGGNAQYLRKARWLHHSSFLWDFFPGRMAYLKMPPKMPAYRKQRQHFDFLCKMKDYLPGPQTFFDQLIDTLSEQFIIHPVSEAELQKCLFRSYRQATAIVDLASFMPAPMPEN
jgi:lipoate---protein ligase